MSLVIFLDALPYDYFEQNYYQFDFDFRINFSRHITSLGYSSNLHWEILADKYPDDLGFFTDWNLKHEKYLNFRNTTIFYQKIISKVEKFSLLTFTLRYLLNKVSKIHFANIPFHLRPFFLNNGIYLLSNKDLMQKYSIFKGYYFILQDEHNLLEENIEDITLKMIEEGKKNIFVSLIFPDKLGHIHGRNDEYNRVITEKLRMTFGLVDRYLKKNKNCKYVIFSDHGMSNIKENVSLKLEEYFGPQRLDRYIYFCDSVILRLWSNDQKLLAYIYNHLGNLSYGKVLTENERKKFRVTNREFGDLIFVLNEGIIFKPNYFGMGIRKSGKGMHGYLPYYENQHGVIISNLNLKEDFDTKAVYNLLNISK